MSALCCLAGLKKVTSFIYVLWHLIYHIHHNRPSAVSLLPIVLSWGILPMHLLHQVFLQTSYCLWCITLISVFPLTQDSSVWLTSGRLPTGECVKELGKCCTLLPPEAAADPPFINPSSFAMEVQSLERFRLFQTRPHGLLLAFPGKYVVTCCTRKLPRWLQSAMPNGQDTFLDD